MMSIDIKNWYYLLSVQSYGHSYNIHVFSWGEKPALPAESEGKEKVLLIDTGLTGINRQLHQLNAKGEYLLFLGSEYRFSLADLSKLVEVVMRDPLFGFVMPRTIRNNIPETNYRQLLAELPADTREVVEGDPVLIRTEVLRNFGFLDCDAPDFVSALARLFIQANRRGYSARRCNTVLFLNADETELGADRSLPQIDRASDFYRALEAQALTPEARLEGLLSKRFSPKVGREVLFDIRNLVPGYNGTAHHILSLLAPITQLADRIAIQPFFWVLRESAEFHGLDELYPDTVIYELPDNRYFDASIRLTQPWSFSELRDQAMRSTINLYTVLDTIAWDCHYIRMPHLEGVWRTMAEHADGLIYISDFSRQLFNNRFPESLEAKNLVAYCSLDPAEYWSDIPHQVFSMTHVVDEPYLLVVGNRYYHKGLNEAVHALSSGFPGVRIKVLGELKTEFHNVEQIPAGNQSHETMVTLFKNCICLIFPSFYEGFGLPIFEALAFGKPVVARHSQLIDEIREKIAPLEDLMPFSNQVELLQQVKGLLNDAAHWSSLVKSSESPSVTYTWEHSAADILQLIDRALASVDLERCRKRLEFYYRIDQFDIERAGWSNSEQNKVIFEVEQEE